MQPTALGGAVAVVTGDRFGEVITHMRYSTS
jgi:hypothetical protein